MDEINERKPLGILMQVSVPVFEGRHHQQYRVENGSSNNVAALGSARVSVKKRNNLDNSKETGNSGGGASNNSQYMVATQNSK